MIDKHRWQQFSFSQKMGNLGSEISRAYLWSEKHNYENEQASLERCLEMAELLVMEPVSPGAKKELCRLKMLVQNNLATQREAEPDYVPIKNALLHFALYKNIK